jgi:hypothetical protein
LQSNICLKPPKGHFKNREEWRKHCFNRLNHEAGAFEADFGSGHLAFKGVGEQLKARKQSIF